MSRGAIFRRLAGLETEYAMRFHPVDSFARGLTKFELYRAVLKSFHRSVTTVPAKHFKEGVFWGSGGAIWFESERLTSNGGLLEGSTPECRGPRQLLAYQRAQDRLLAEAAAKADVPGTLALIKNCRDARDNVYGAQENYEATIARGWQLIVWRAGLIALLPLFAVTWIALWLIIVAILLYLAGAGLAFLLIRAVAKHPERWSLLLFGRDFTDGSDTGNPIAPWLESVLIWTARIACLPTALGLMLLIRLVAFRRIRRYLLPLLISRPVLCGAGMVDRSSEFQLADKAPSINCIVGLGGLVWDRPVFNFGHLFKTASFETVFAPGEFRSLFASRQRLQLGLGDSNMADVAEYLRIGTTMLVLDAIEAGQLPPPPRIRRPIRTLRRLCKDLTLANPLPLVGGATMTALQIQRSYLEACQQFVEKSENPPAEAREVLSLWDQALSGLETASETLIGQLDWVTKKYLLDEVAADADWSERKKIDIRYHELSDEGYFRRLAQTGLAVELVAAEEIDRAIRTAPPDSPATMRGHYIREFSGGDRPLAVNWRRVVLGSGRQAKVIRLSQYQDD